jgi:putative ABC transport system permease protein
MTMWCIARSNIRAFRASFAGAFVVVVLASALLSALGALIESGLRGGVVPQRYADIEVVVTADYTSGQAVGGAGLIDAPLLPDDAVTDIASVPGVAEVGGEVDLGLATQDGTAVTGHDWDLTGRRDGALTAGTAPSEAGDIVVDAALGHEVGDRIELSYGAVPSSYTVVGLTDDHVSAGRPMNVYLGRDDIDDLWPQGVGLSRVVGVFVGDGVSAGGVAGRIDEQVPGVDAFTGTDRGIAEFPDSRASASCLLAVAGSIFGTASLLIGFVVVSTLSLSVRQRRRQFALLRTIGATPGQLRVGIVCEIVLVSVWAVPIGAIPGLFAARMIVPVLRSGGVITDDFLLVLSPVPAVAAGMTTVVVSVLAALIAARRTISVAPIEALREATVEEPTIGRARWITALVVGAIGLAASLTPIVVPGVIGGAMAGSSAILLICAVALAGPPIVIWLLDRFTPMIGRSRHATVEMAAANSRGFSRRLAAAIVPFALVLAFGVVQTITNATISAESSRQLRDGLTADLIVAGPAGISTDLADEIAASRVVNAVVPLRSATLGIAAGSDDDKPFGSRGLGWEATPVRAVPANVSTSVLDLDVSSGELADLGTTDTIAVSSDFATEFFLGVNDSVAIRYGDGVETTAEIAAIYDRGLGFGPIVIGTDTLLAHSPRSLVDEILVDTDSADSAAVTDTFSSLGLDVIHHEEFITSAVEASDTASELSQLILLALLAFVAVAAVNNLAMATAARRDEFTLLQRIGATSRQLTRTTAVEAAITSGAALGIGAAAVVPAALGLGLGISSNHLATIDWFTVSGLPAATVVSAFAGTTIVSAVVNRQVARRSLTPTR